MGAGLAVRGRRPVVEAPDRRPGVAPLAQLALERPVRAPALEHPELELGERLLRIYGSKAAHGRLILGAPLLLTSSSRPPPGGTRGQPPPRRWCWCRRTPPRRCRSGRRRRPRPRPARPRRQRPTVATAVHRAMLRPKSTSYCPVPTAPTLVTVTPPLWLSSTAGGADLREQDADVLVGEPEVDDLAGVDRVVLDLGRRDPVGRDLGLGDRVGRQVLGPEPASGLAVVEHLGAVDRAVLDLVRADRGRRRGRRLPIVSVEHVGGRQRDAARRRTSASRQHVVGLDLVVADVGGAAPAPFSILLVSHGVRRAMSAVLTSPLTMSSLNTVFAAVEGGRGAAHREREQRDVADHVRPDVIPESHWVLPVLSFRTEALPFAGGRDPRSVCPPRSDPNRSARPDRTV